MLMSGCLPNLWQCLHHRCDGEMKDIRCLFHDHSLRVALYENVVWLVNDDFLGNCMVQSIAHL